MSAIVDTRQSVFRGEHGRYIIVRARWVAGLDEWSVADYVEDATDNLIEALWNANVLRLSDDGTSWNATQIGPWQVFDTDMPNWLFNKRASFVFNDWD